ncbi:Pr6Pr family membrane protein [Dinghuibacter silviterrae]|uniref:FAR-17a/AIG1-like protein n=1 Tax=Dinghuibacter silviterrae TaxID=1539049 RepID=A0A4V3GKM8_9BACT|nr:Pr6Pr family membrane protein [Dinghuibacter silviterrae]TDW96302.1 hypothetical protein EDB95_4128 [Dinghuibacter silviterrae]
MLESYSLPAVLCRILLAIAGWVTLILQFFLIRSAGEAMGQTLGMTTGNFFSYFTILTNLLVAFSLSVALFYTRSGMGAFFSRASVQTAIAGCMLVVGGVYHLVLAKLWNPHGSQWAADVLLHTVLPLFYLVYWILFVPKGNLGLSAPLPWLLYPLVYLLYTLGRGALLGWYPYPFLNAGDLGYAMVLGNSAVLLGVFLVLFYVLTLADRAMGSKMHKP